MTQRIKWGVLGTGLMAKWFCHDLPYSETGELYAVASRKQRTAEQFARDYGATKAYGSYEALLADPQVDVVYVALPNHLHCAWTVRSAESGKAVLCEKPLATNAAEAMVLVEACREHRVFLMEAFMYRTHPQTERLVELIKSGAIGEVRLIHAHFSYHMGKQLDNIRLISGYGGGAIMDIGTYAMSMARLLAGAARCEDFAEPLELKGVAHIGEPHGVDEWATATLRFPGDILANLTCGNQVDMLSRVHVWGDTGDIEVLNPWNPAKDMANGTLRLRKRGEVETTDIEFPAERPLYAVEADAVARSISGLEAPPPCMTWADSLGNMQALDWWRREVGLVFDHEKSEAMTQPFSGHPLTVRQDHSMTYARVTGVDKPVSRVVLGTPPLNVHRLPHAFALLDYFFAHGGNCIDTAWIYRFGDSEKAVGEWFKRRGIRDQIVLIGKGACSIDCTPEMITEHLEESLDRLQTDYVDIYMMHRDNPRIPAGEFVACMNEHVRAGRIRAFGGSNWTPPRIAEANAYAKAHNLIGFAASSPQFALAQWNEATWTDCYTATDAASIDWYQRNQGVAIFAWSSQAAGFFTGKYDGKDLSNPVVADIVRVWFNPGNFERLARARALAKQKGVTANQVALAYVLQHPLRPFALIGPETIEEVRTSLGAVNLPLTPDEIRHLNLEA